MKAQINTNVDRDWPLRQSPTLKRIPPLRSLCRAWQAPAAAIVLVAWFVILMAVTV